MTFIKQNERVFIMNALLNWFLRKNVFTNLKYLGIVLGGKCRESNGFYIICWSHTFKEPWVLVHLKKMFEKKFVHSKRFDCKSDQINFFN